MSFSFPKIYPILDASFIPSHGRADFLHKIGASLTDAGVTILEYRNKSGTDSELIGDAKALRSSMPAGQVKLILDDRVDLVETVGFDGVHVDAGDVPPSEARRTLGPNRVIGTFGGGESLLPGILNEPVDYLAIGPVFATTTKETSRQPIGIAGVKRLRDSAGPGVVLSAAAGITLEAATAVLAAGATTVAVAAALFRNEDPAAEFALWRAHLG